MDNMQVYQINVKRHEAEVFLDAIQSHLAVQGYKVKVHIHEPPQQMEIFEFAKGEVILSVEVDRREMQNTVVRFGSADVDPNAIVVKVISKLCTELAVTFVRPLAEHLDRGLLEASFGRTIEDFVAGRKAG
jgi:hypothetical protein